MNDNKISIIIPAKNESGNLETLLPELKKSFGNSEIIVVNDGSSDNTVDVCGRYGVQVISHQYSIGNGAAIKSGARAATGDILLFMDGDGQHNPDEIRILLDEMRNGYDMVVGARAYNAHADIGRGVANSFYNVFASWITGHRIHDLTSGFRAVNAAKFKEFLFLLPNGFSYPTTITMAFFRSGYSVSYIPVKVLKRKGNSHLHPIKDGIRFLLIIFKVGTLYTPLKFFFPISMFFFITGFGYYMYTFITQGRFTNMSALLFISSILVFLIGLVSEQLTVLMYQDKK